MLSLGPFCASLVLSLAVLGTVGWLGFRVFRTLSVLFKCDHVISTASFCNNMIVESAVPSFMQGMDDDVRACASVFLLRLLKVYTSFGFCSGDGL